MKRNLNNNVMSKIAGITKNKVELKSEVVELGLVQDIKKTNSEINSNSDKVSSIIKDMASGRKKIESLLSEVDKVKSMLNKWESIFGELKISKEDASSLLSKAITQAKELGVDFTDIDGFMALAKKETDADKLLKKLKAEANQLGQVMNKLR